MSKGKVKPTIGTPTMVLLPANNYCFRVSKKKHKIIIPRKGTYHDLDPEFYSEEEGEFSLLDEKNNTMYLPSITKVLFGVEKYPDLKQNEVFAPLFLVFKKNNVEIIGQVIEMLGNDDPDCVQKK